MQMSQVCATPFKPSYGRFAAGQNMYDGGP